MNGRPDEPFMAEMQALESTYVLSDDPLVQSGYRGGPRRWEDERRPLTTAIHRSGSFLDVGCANGWLAKCVFEWCQETGVAIEPFGVDLGERLIRQARSIHDRIPANFFAADAWSWDPPRLFTFAYSLIDLSPKQLRGVWVERLSSWVEPGGRVILGSYGSRSRAVAPDDIVAILEELGLAVAGSSSGGDEPLARYAWIEI